MHILHDRWGTPHESGGLSPVLYFLFMVDTHSLKIEYDHFCITHHHGYDELSGRRQGLWIPKVPVARNAPRVEPKGQPGIRIREAEHPLTWIVLVSSSNRGLVGRCSWLYRSCAGHRQATVDPDSQSCRSGFTAARSPQRASRLNLGVGAGFGTGRRHVPTSDCGAKAPPVCVARVACVRSEAVVVGLGGLEGTSSGANMDSLSATFNATANGMPVFPVAQQQNADHDGIEHPIVRA